MASRKDLKKAINYIVSELFTECVFISLHLQDDFLSRISHTEPGNVKAFYQKLREDFNNRVGEILEAMGQLKK